LQGKLANNIFCFPYLERIPSSFSYNDSVVVTVKNDAIQMERILTTFTTIVLSNNGFEGVIPSIIGELKGITFPTTESLVLFHKPWVVYKIWNGLI